MPELPRCECFGNLNNKIYCERHVTKVGRTAVCKTQEGMGVRSARHLSAEPEDSLEDEVETSSSSDTKAKGSSCSWAGHWCVVRMWL